MSEKDLKDYFETNHLLMHDERFGRYNLSELENMIPWERDVYIAITMNKMQEELNNVGK